MTAILSIHDGSHDSSAALFDDYRIVAAAQKERLTRVKKDGGAPHECVREVLDLGGIRPEEVDVVVFTRCGFPEALLHTGLLRRLQYAIKGARKVDQLSRAMKKANTLDASEVLDVRGALEFYGLPPALPAKFL
ncbi:MAG TPA: carbamoyltransferase N-terminal domain-containing protein, partial [Stellaceae bacterium]|nr:carbamoyltransferase N-terminal domain-containing protein [Stellaceae bacterium]